MKFKSVLKKAWSRLCKAFPFALCILSILLSLLLPHGREKAQAEAKQIVTVWNVDTFEGGKGSRTSFLKKSAKKIEKRMDNVYFLISSYTIEGAQAALKKGIKPDALSFGVGLSDFAELSLPLEYSFSGGQTEEGCLAYPWCRGEYSLFSLTDNFEEEGEIAISHGGNNLACVAAAYAQIEGESVESLEAYTNFLSGKYRYLLGTQRDECRFVARGVQVYRKALPTYCDLYQYYSVLSAQKRELCFALLDELLSQGTQEALAEIGMRSVRGGEDCKTVSVFSSAEALERLCGIARSGEDIKNLDKFLKKV